MRRKPPVRICQECGAEFRARDNGWYIAYGLVGQEKRIIAYCPTCMRKKLAKLQEDK